MATNKKTDVVVIGAGLTGLTTAFYLRKRGIDFKVLEHSNRVGGVIDTETESGFTYEKGPNTGVISHPEVAELFEHLEGAAELEIADKSAQKRLVLKNGKWYPLPSDMKTGVKTPLFSLKDKFRLLAEPWRKSGADPMENLRDLVYRRLGKSYLDYAVDPFILGIYAGDPKYLIPKYALPKLYNLEQQYGSFIKGSIQKSKERRNDTRLQKSTREVFSVKGGLNQLIYALYQKAGPESIVLEQEGIRIKPEEDNFTITSATGTQFQANKVITTTGAFALPALLPYAEQRLIDRIAKLIYAKVVQVTLGFKNWNGMNLDAFGGLVPSKENRDILGALFLSSFLRDRAPEYSALISVFLGGMRRPEIYNLSDKQIKNIVSSEIQELFEIDSFNPELLRINRYRHAIPQYGKESPERLKAIKQLQNNHPGLFIGGNCTGGIGMADRIKQAKELAYMV